MAKKLLEFEGKLINVSDLKLIEKFERWDDKDLEMKFNIEINRPYNESPLSNMCFVFSYKTEEKRDQRMELLQIQLDGLEHVEIIGGL